MSLLSRTKDILGSTVSKFIEKHEDPLKTLDYAYEKQVEQLTKVKAGIANLVTSKNKLEQQKTKMCESIFTLDEQATNLVKQGDEALARTVLAQKVDTEDQIQNLTVQIKEMREVQAKLTQQEKQLELEIQQFKSKKELMKAQYSAAKAQSDIAESVTGMGNSTSASNAIKRAGDKTDSMKARASALGELQETGVLTNSMTDENSIDRSIRENRNKSKVDDELKALRNATQK